MHRIKGQVSDSISEVNLSQKHNSSHMQNVSHNTTQQHRPFSVLITGVKGMGKSLFSRNILINLKQLELLVS